MRQLPTKGTLESVVLGFDFSAETLSLTIVSVTCELRPDGADDPDPTAVLDGPPQVDIGNPANVLQRVIGGVNAASYTIQCTVTTPDGDTLTLGVILPVSEFP